VWAHAVQVGQQSRRTTLSITVAPSINFAHSAGRWQPEETASLTSRLLFKYAVGIMKLGSQKYLVQEDLWAVSR